MSCLWKNKAGWIPVAFLVVFDSVFSFSWWVALPNLIPHRTVSYIQSKAKQNMGAGIMPRCLSNNNNKAMYFLAVRDSSMLIKLLLPIPVTSDL